MVRALTDRARERVEDWDVVEVWGGWEETAPGQVPAEIACVLVAEPGFPTRQAFLVTT